ncbi:hypothetical protein LCGC14_2357170 [marine sediment metagenome]|uniref:Uncharacterized protein n=1 Tax=marine sediment metagenome TaxID=412755 RepID=A0A0F9EK93_9ZZZZ
MFLSIIILICTVAVLLGYINPLSHWGSYWCVFRTTCKDKQLPKNAELLLDYQGTAEYKAIDFASYTLAIGE